MNFSQLQEAFAAYTANSVQADPAQLALWFNEALYDLAASFGPVCRLELTQKAGTDIALPQDALAIIAADDDYRLLPDGTLSFPRGFSGALWYRCLPQLFDGTDAGQECPLHPVLHYLVALFAVSRCWDVESEGDSEESNQAAKWLAYYYQGKNLARASMQLLRADIDAWVIK